MSTHQHADPGPRGPSRRRIALVAASAVAAVGVVTALLVQGEDACSGAECAADVAATAPERVTPPARAERAPVALRPGYTVATLNVLGHSHTKSGGKRSHYAPAPERMDSTIDLLLDHEVDVVGLQEFQRSQQGWFQRRAGDVYDLYAPDRDNAIAWRRATWELVDQDTFEIPYFFGRPRPMPLVRLRHRLTGEEVVVLSVHNPASIRRVGDMSAQRAEALRIEQDLVERIHRQEDVPVLLVGDFNARGEVFCDLTESGLLRSSAGPRPEGEPCVAPEDGIDWIFGTRDVDFVSHARLRGPLVSRTTDHPLVVARVEGQ